ncbi:MAG: cytochrome c oxidase accessory protein CcoG [Melioribacteraceae bacterium]|nr:cytochrome c oxidase accessory protein CcoG [Melioribacteraceae bacterium]
MKDRDLENNQNAFRDQISTVTDEGKRVWIYPKKPSGRFYNARTIVSIFLLAFLFGAPFLKVNGHQFMLFNVLERKFILFGIPFGPHDFHLFGLAMIAIIVSIFLFTVVYGRIFCGWICPQTIFMEMVFRKIEYWIEGDANKQRALDKMPMNAEKFIKKTSKQIIFFVISFIIANFFLSYIIGMDQLIVIVTDPITAHLGGLFAITVFSGIFYWVFSYFREQACTIVCPYGRLQGVMLDQNSIVIAYDNVRGEPRGKIRKNESRDDKGDCIDCNLCVDVCPTGIDIRHGTQLECVNCTACIDACDNVMDKINKPRGLIRYASKNEIDTQIRKIFTPRALGYTFVLILLLGLISFLLINRTEVELTILRTPGILFQEQPNNKISNLYDVKIINKTFDEFPVTLKLENIDGEIILIGNENLLVEPQGIAEAKFLVILSKDDIKTMKTPIDISVASDEKVIDVIRTSFLGKVNRNNEGN